MTFIGKLLVLVNVLVSVLLLAFAIGVYTQRIDRFNRRVEGGDEIIGKITQLQAKLADLVEAKTRAEARWASAQIALVELEDELPKRREWYGSVLTFIETGKWRGGAEVLNAVRQLNLAGDGKFELDTPDEWRTLIEIRQGAPLRNIIAANREIDNTHGELKNAYDNLKALIAEEKDLTNQIIDTEVKGLRTLIKEQTDILQRAEDELAYLTPLLTNRRAESQLLTKRKAALEDRLAELRKFYGASSGQ